jgi:hypothetical protein
MSPDEVVVNQGGDGPPPPPEKGVADILVEAFQLYRTHARALLMTCALLIVPASLVKSSALAWIAGPTAEVASATIGDMQGLVQRADAARRDLADAYARHADPQTIDHLQREQQAILSEMSSVPLDAARNNVGNFGMYMLGLLGTLLTAFFLYGIIVPLTNGALTIAVADRVLGGNAGWREIWMLLFRRVGKLAAALIPAALLIALGFVFFVIPGIVLALLFAFVSPVVMIEGLGGRAALRRSVELVRADWLRVALVVIVFGVINAAARILARALVPHAAVFLDSFLGDLFTMILLPVPVLGAVLLYFDVRRKREGFTPDHLRADLAALAGDGTASSV